MTRLTQFIRENIALTFGVLAIIAYFLPYWIMGPNSYVTFHDNLDSVFVNMKVLFDSGLLFASSDTIIPQYDIPRLSFGSEFNFIYALNYIFSPFWSYVMMQVIIKATAFTGMILLLKNHLVPNRQNSEFEKNIVILIATAFALLPAYSYSTLSIAALPLALYCFLNIRKGDRRIFNWLIILLLPFFSSFIFSFIFFLFFMGLLFVYDFLKTRKINWLFGSAVCLMTTVYLATEYRIMLAIFDPVFVSHRTEFVIRYTNMEDTIQAAIKNFKYGQYHAPGFHNLIILPVTIAALLLSVFRRLKYKNTVPKALWISMLIIALTAAFYGFWKSEMIMPLRENVGFFKEFNMARFHWLHPALWYVCFGLSILYIGTLWKDKNKFIRPILYITVLTQIIFVGFYNHEIVTAKNKHDISYNAFFAPELFAEIEKYIGRPQGDYEVMSVGMNSTIAAYNGFQTYDLYTQLYPLSRKHEFRKVTLNQLNKDDGLKKYFDEWGSRLYLFTPELQKDFFGKKHNGPIENLDIDNRELNQIGVQYIFSRVPINKGVKFIKKFEHPNSHWDIYVYRV